MLQGILPYPILQYIVDEELAVQNGAKPAKLPPMDELAQALGMSRGKLREDLIVAQAYGVVEMRPGDGTYVRPLDFYTVMRTLVLYSTACDWENFDHFYKLRVQVEIGFWDEATANLTEEDKQELLEVVERAEQKLKGSPAEIPHREHRNLHLLMFRRLENGFVQGLLKTYWDAYEAVGLHRYFDLSYYESMWANHRAIVEALVNGQTEKGQEILVRHFTLLDSRLRGATT